MSKTLLIIDMQNDYFPGGTMELVNVESAGSQARKLLERCREENVKVVHVQHISLRKGAPFFNPDTWGVEINDCVKPKPEETIVTKHFPNSFRKTSLLEHIHPEQTEELIICGSMVQMCIDTTVRAAFDLGFKCTVAADACATRDLSYGEKVVPAVDVHAAFMAAFQPLYASVRSSEEIISDLAT